MIGLIRDHYGEEVDLAHLPADDGEVYRTLQRADTIGMFQRDAVADRPYLAGSVYLRGFSFPAFRSRTPGPPPFSSMKVGAPPRLIRALAVIFRFAG